MRCFLDKLPDLLFGLFKPAFIREVKHFAVPAVVLLNQLAFNGDIQNAMHNRNRWLVWPHGEKLLDLLFQHLNIVPGIFCPWEQLKQKVVYGMDNVHTACFTSQETGIVG